MEGLIVRNTTTTATTLILRTIFYGAVRLWLWQSQCKSFDERRTMSDSSRRRL